MTLPPFALERFFARFEFEVPHNLCASDAQTRRMDAFVARADADARALWDNLELGYTQSLGHALLRAAMAARCGVDAKDILVFSGAQEAIYVWARACLNAGDHVVCLVPAYQSLFEVARAQGCELTLVSVREEDAWAFDLHAMTRALRPNTRAIIINTPHNPTGMHLRPDELASLAALADERGITLVCDEVYRGLELDAQDTLPAAASLSASAVSISVLSKAFGLAGLRIGWVATRDTRALEAMAAYKDYTTICASGPSEILALMALRDSAHILEENRALLRANLALGHAFFAQHQDLVAWTPPRAGPVCMARLRDGSDARAFALRAADEHGVLVMPAGVFGLEGPGFRLGLARTGFAAGLERLAAALRAPRL